MKRIVLFVIFCLAISVNVWANDDMQIIDAENDILAVGTTRANYKKNMTIDNNLVDGAASEAIAESNKYTSLSRKPKVKVKLELKNCPSKAKLCLDSSLSNYSGLIDEIIIDAGGVYCYVAPQRLIGTDDKIELNISDSDKIISKYNGTGTAKLIKMLLSVIFASVALFLVFFILVFVRKNNFKEGFNKKILYLTGCITIALCFFSAVTLFCFTPEIGENISKLDEGNELHLFEIEYGGNLTAADGVYLGIPLYDESFNSQYVTACMYTSDTAEGYTVLGGSYIGYDDVLKFPIRSSGSYYIKNNIIKFNDISENEKGLAEAVSVLASKNIVSGKAEGMFGPEDNITRAEIVTILCKMLSLNTEGSHSQGFSDISSSDWYYKYVMTGKENNLLAGFEDNTFHPTDNITRQQVAVIAGQLMQNMGYTLSDDVSGIYKFEDNGEIRDYAAAYISLLVRENINIWENYYEPDRPLTRGEAAVILYRLYLLIQ